MWEEDAPAPPVSAPAQEPEATPEPAVNEPTELEVETEPEPAPAPEPLPPVVPPVNEAPPVPGDVPEAQPADEPWEAASTPESARAEAPQSEPSTQQWGQPEPPAPASDPLPPVVPPVEETPSQEWSQPQPAQQAGGWEQPSAQESHAWAGHQQPQHQQGQHYAQQPAQHPPVYQSSPPPGRPPKKNGKGALIFLIVLALIIAVAFAWALMRYLSNDSQPSTETTPETTAAATETPTAEELEAEAMEQEQVEADTADLTAEEPQDLEQLAIEAGLQDLVDFYNEFDVRDAEIGSDVVELGPKDSADVVTIMVTPAGGVQDQDVGKLAIEQVERDWSTSNAPMPCPEPDDGEEYIKLQLSADTTHALQDYAFSGLELRFFDDDGKETGVVNSILTGLCFGDFGAISNAWERGAGYTGGALAKVGPGTTTAAYSAAWGYGVNDTVYRWDLGDF